MDFEQNVMDISLDQPDKILLFFDVEVPVSFNDFSMSRCLHIHHTV